MAADLRSFLEQVRQRWPEDWQVVKKEVDPRYEITGLVVRCERERRRPVILFERVKDTPYPVVTNVHSRARLALAMRSTPREMVKDFLHAMASPIPPRVVATGPVAGLQSSEHPWVRAYFRGRRVHGLESPVAQFSN